MRIGLIQHEIDSPPGTALLWLRQRGIEFTHRQMHLNDSLPSTNEVDHLIICGGSMNVDEEAKHSWLNPEKKLIESVIRNGGKVLGLCLGGQLAAEVLGGKVGPHHDWEVGWHDMNIEAVPGLAGFETSRTLPVFQWHRYRFETPPEALRIASNPWWGHQAFLWNKQVLGFQFHPETDLDWNRECALDRGLPTTGQSQDPETILRLGEKYQPAMQAWFTTVLDGFFSTHPG